MADKFKTELEQARRESRNGGRTAWNSIRWFQNTVKNVIKSPEKAMEEWKYKKGTRIKIGQMCLYVYDPKTKDTLPWYDTYPLIFPLRTYSDGFLGMNVHYLPPEMRVFLLDKIYNIWNSDKISDRKKEALNGEVLNAMRNMAEFKPCVKRYLNSHLRSLILPVPVNQWDKVILLNLDSFKKASRETVWEHSLSQM